MPMLKARTEAHDQVELHFEDVGTGRPVVLIHGWPLSGRSWEAQVPALVEAGYRVITYDRRGFGGSSQPWDGYDYDTFADDLDAVLSHLELQQVTLVGFSMGGGEVVRYLARHGSSRIEKAVLAGAVPPYLYKSDDNPDGGLDDATIEAFQAGVRGDRLEFLDEFLKNFFGTGLLKKNLVSEPFRLYMRDIAAYASPKGTLDCITAFGRTDFREDLDQGRRAHPGDPRRLRRHRAVRGQRPALRRGHRGQHARGRQGRSARVQRHARGGVQPGAAGLPGEVASRKTVLGSSRPRITSTASGLASTSTNRRPSAAATAPVVPLPAKKSSTQSPGREDGESSRRSTPSGFWVG